MFAVEEKNIWFHWEDAKIGRPLHEASAGFLTLNGGDNGFGFRSLTISGRVNSQWADRFFGLGPVDERKAVIENVMVGTWKVEFANGNKGEWTLRADGAVIGGPWTIGNWDVDLRRQEVLIAWGNGYADRFDLPIDSKGATGATVGRGNVRFAAIKLR